MESKQLQNGHENEIVKYLTFARLNRGQRLQAINASFKEIKESRLNEDTFTHEEVTTILDDLCSVIRGDIESEFINISHTNVLLLRQLFVQAEKWHLQLQTDVSELENRKLLEEIATFEQVTFSSHQSNKEFHLSQATKLQPLNEDGRMILLNQEIKRLQDDNSHLKEKLAILEKKLNEQLGEKSFLVEQMKEQCNMERTQQQSTPKSNEDINRQIESVKEETARKLKEAEVLYKKQASSLEEELAHTKHYVLALKHSIDELEVELQKKFSDSTQYSNMKKMLDTKNNQIKSLRQHMKTADPSFEM